MNSTQRARRWVLAATLSALIMLAGWWYLRGSSANFGPRYQGKTIQWYLQRLSLEDDGQNQKEREAATSEAVTALRAMGEPAVVWLASHLEFKDTPGEKRYRGVIDKLPQSVQGVLPATNHPPTASESQLNPQILRALVAIGPPSIPVLTNYLNANLYNQSTRQEIYHVFSFPPLVTAGTQALPILQAQLRGTNDFDRLAAAYAIAQIEPARVAELVPTFTAGLRAFHRLYAVNCLGNLGPEAVGAKADLESCLDDPDPRFREETRVALQKVTGKSYPRR